MEGATAALKFSKIIGEEDILLSMHADRKRSAMGGIAARLGERAGSSQGAVLAALLRRERLGPTAVGHGVAIPHARVDGISGPAAVAATLRRPVPFDSPDDQPVDLLLALLWPNTDVQGFVPALAGIWRQLRHGDLARRLRQSRTAAEAHAWIEALEHDPRHESAEFEDEPVAGFYPGEAIVIGSPGPTRIAAGRGAAFDKQPTRLQMPELTVASHLTRTSAAILPTQGRANC